MIKETIDLEIAMTKEASFLGAAARAAVRAARGAGRVGQGVTRAVTPNFGRAMTGTSIPSWYARRPSIVSGLVNTMRNPVNLALGGGIAGYALGNSDAGLGLAGRMLKNRDAINSALNNGAHSALDTVQGGVDYLRGKLPAR